MVNWCMHNGPDFLVERYLFIICKWEYHMIIRHLFTSSSFVLQALKAVEISNDTGSIMMNRLRNCISPHTGYLLSFSLKCIWCMTF